MKKLYIASAFALCLFSLISARENLAILTPGTQSAPFTLDDRLYEIADHFNGHLDRSIAFNTTFLRDIRAVREHLTNPHTFGGQQKKVRTPDKQEIHYTYFNRNSDTLLVIAPGFPGKREELTPFVEMFDTYDIVILDFRGFNFTEQSWYNPFSWKLHPSQYVIKADGKVSRMGEIEEQDILAVINTVKRRKQYKRTFGLGTCYSTIIMAKAAATGKNVFDKLILDGTPCSIKELVYRHVEDLKLLFSNGKRTGWKNLWPLRLKCVQKTILFFAEILCRIKFSKYNVEALDYLVHLDIPILFVHGMKDAIVTYESFKHNWQNTPTRQKCALITPHEHVTSHIKDKKLYKLTCDLFFESTYQEFIDCMKHPKKIIQHKLEQLEETPVMP